MRQSLLVLLVAAAYVSATGCAYDDLEDFIGDACGNKAAIVDCLRGDMDLGHFGDIQLCFLEGGCPPHEAQLRASGIANICGGEGAHDMRQELKRQNDDESTADQNPPAKTVTSKAASNPTPVTTAKDSDTATSETAPEPTTAPSTAPSTAATTEATPTSNTPATTPTNATPTAAAATSKGTTTGTVTTPLVCSVTSMKPTKMCSVTGGSTLGCTSTTTAIASCAPGLICFKNEQCMKRDDTLTTGGIITTIAFGFSITAVSLAILIVKLRERSKNKRDAAARVMAAANYKAKDIEGGPRNYSHVHGTRGSEADLPLIAPGNVRSDEADSEHRGGGGVPPMPPKLHKGVSGLPQQHSQHWSEDYGNHRN